MVHMVRNGLRFRQDEAIGLRIVSEPLSTTKRGYERCKKYKKNPKSEICLSVKLLLSRVVVW